jgi:hypothetical protein
MAQAGPKTEQPGWTSPAEEIQRTVEYENETINRFKTGQYLTASDRREAKRLIAKRQADDGAA